RKPACPDHRDSRADWPCRHRRAALAAVAPGHGLPAMETGSRRRQYACAWVNFRRAEILEEPTRIGWPALQPAAHAARLAGMNFSLCFSDVPIKPFQISLHAIDQQSRLFDAVRGARVDHHPGRAALPFERVVELVALRKGHALVALAVLDQGWR